MRLFVLSFLACLLVRAAAAAEEPVVIHGDISYHRRGSQSCAHVGGSEFESSDFWPVRLADVEIRSMADITLARTITNDDGEFSVTITNLKPPAGFKVVVWARTSVAEVFNHDANQSLGVAWTYDTSYAVNLIYEIIGPEIDRSMPFARAAFWVMDAALKGHDYAFARGSSLPAQLDIYLNGSPGEAYYDSLTNDIVLGSGMEWHSRIFHEYGHYIDDVARPVIGSAGLSAHYYCDAYPDLTGAFGEGWAHYIMYVVSGKTYAWPGAVQGSPFSGYGQCNVEVDDCSTRSPGCEGNIASVLWDLYDSRAEAFDNVTGGEQKVWDTNFSNTFIFSHPTLASFLAEYNDSAADLVGCHYAVIRCPTCYHIDSHVSPAGSGSISYGTFANCNTGYTANLPVTIRAVAFPGYAFSGWSSTGGGTFSSQTSTSTTFTITGNSVITATFKAPCTSFTLSETSTLPNSLAGWITVGVLGQPNGCQGGNWNASGNGSWLTVSPTSGNEPGTVTVSWTPNTIGSSRTGTATIVGIPFTVIQSGRRRRAGRSATSMVMATSPSSRATDPSATICSGE